MIKQFVEKFDKARPELEAFFAKAHVHSYETIVEKVIEVVTSEEYEDFAPDPKRIHRIDDGDYQGTLLFVIAEKDYQPSSYYYVKVYYGSCSGCDTLQAISDYGDGPPTKDQIADYMALALHIVQGLKAMQNEDGY